MSDQKASKYYAAEEEQQMKKVSKETELPELSYDFNSKTLAVKNPENTVHTNTIAGPQDRTPHKIS